MYNKLRRIIIHALASLQGMFEATNPKWSDFMPTLFVLVLWFILSFVVASAANQRGRGPVSWFLLSILTTPLVAALLLLLFPIQDRLAVSPGSEMPQEIVDDGSPDQTHPMLLLIFLCLVGAAVTTVWVLSSDRKSFSPNGAEQTTLQRTTYEQVTTMPCVNLLNAFGTRFFSELADPIAATIGERKGGLGSAINIASYALTECRLDESKTIGQAIESLLEQKRRGRLPRIPVGGATNDPQVQASWIAFEKWIRHTGPKPNLR